jgi:hypothetical protein
MRKLVCQTIIVLAVGVLAGITAKADDLECSGTLGELVVDNLIVPPAASCNLAGTRVQGNINVGTNATLIANNAVITGNVHATGFRSVFLGQGTEVNGNVELKNGRRGDIRNSTVRQNLVFENNRGKLIVRVVSVGGSLHAVHNSGKLQIESNPVIRGNLQVFDHAGRVKINENLVDQDLQVFRNIGRATLRDNQIRGNLQCKENNPAAVASRNLVGGNSECER